MTDTSASALAFTLRSVLINTWTSYIWEEACHWYALCDWAPTSKSNSPEVTLTLARCLVQHTADLLLYHQCPMLELEC